MLFNFKTKYAIISCSKVKKNCLKGGNMKNYYPFSAIVGQNEMKLALILSIINPKIKGVLIFGEKESAEIGRASCREECRSRWSPYN